MLTDVLICGGGPAGLAAAIACRLQGLNVVVVEFGSAPADKACGEGLLPEAVAALHALGVEPGARDGSRLQGIRFVSGNRTTEASFASGEGLGLRRTTLHTALRERAESTGAALLWRTQVKAITAASESVTAETSAGTVRARWCIGADGLNSRVRLWSGLAPDRDVVRQRTGMRTHFRIAPWSAFVEVYWGASSQCYITPVGPDEVSVAVLSRGGRRTVDEALCEFPALEQRLRGAARTSKERGAATFTRTLPRVVRGSVALLGDASGSVDAITGAGLGLAFQQALALAPALAAGRLSDYERAHAAIMRRPVLMARGLLLLDRYAGLRRLCFAGFGAVPGLFDGLLRFHTGEPILSRGSRAIMREDCEAACDVACVSYESESVSR